MTGRSPCFWIQRISAADQAAIPRAAGAEELRAIPRAAGGVVSRDRGQASFFLLRRVPRLPYPYRPVRSRERDGRRVRAGLSLIHISEPTRLRRISYAVFCLKKKKKKQNIQTNRKKQQQKQKNIHQTINYNT